MSENSETYLRVGIDGSAAVSGGRVVKRSLDEISSSADSTGSHLSSMKDILFGLAGAAVGVYGVATAIQAIGNYAKESLNYLGLIETSTLGIASSFLVSGNYIDTITGKALTGQRSLIAAQQESETVINQLRYANLQTIATLDELIVSYQTTLPVAMSRGFDKKMVMEFNTAMVQAAGAIGLPFNQMAEETRSLLIGTINPRNSRIATVLGLRNEDIAKYKGDAQGLFSFLMGRLEGFRVTGEASMQTWKGLWSNFKDVSQQASGMLFEPVFNKTKQALSNFLKDAIVIDPKNQTYQLSQSILNLVDNLQLMAKILYESGKALTAYIVIYKGGAVLETIFSWIAAKNELWRTEIKTQAAIEAGTAIDFRKGAGLKIVAAEAVATAEANMLLTQSTIANIEADRAQVLSNIQTITSEQELNAVKIQSALATQRNALLDKEAAEFKVMASQAAVIMAEKELAANIVHHGQMIQQLEDLGLTEVALQQKGVALQENSVLAGNLAKTNAALAVEEGVLATATNNATIAQERSNIAISQSATLAKEKQAMQGLAAAQEIELTGAKTAHTAAQEALNKANARAAIVNKEVAASIFTMGNALNVLMAAWIGWQIGTWLQEKSAAVRQFGVVIVNTLVAAWELASEAYERFVATVNPFGDADKQQEELNAITAKYDKMRQVRQQVITEMWQEAEQMKKINAKKEASDYIAHKPLNDANDKLAEKRANAWKRYSDSWLAMQDATGKKELQQDKIIVDGKLADLELEKSQGLMTLREYYAERFAIQFLHTTKEKQEAIARVKETAAAVVAAREAASKVSGVVIQGGVMMPTKDNIPSLNAMTKVNEAIKKNEDAQAQLGKVESDQQKFRRENYKENISFEDSLRKAKQTQEVDLGKYNLSLQDQLELQIKLEDEAIKSSGVHDKDYLKQKKQLDDLRRSSLTAYGGMRDAIKEYGDMASNIGEQVKTAFSGMFKEIENAITDSIVKMKLDFKSLFQFIQTEAVRIAIARPITNAISGAFAPGTKDASGNIVGAGALAPYAVPIAGAVMAFSIITDSISTENAERERAAETLRVFNDTMRKFNDDLTVRTLANTGKTNEAELTQLANKQREEQLAIIRAASQVAGGRASAYEENGLDTVAKLKAYMSAHSDLFTPAQIAQQEKDSWSVAGLTKSLENLDKVQKLEIVALKNKQALAHNNLLLTEMELKGLKDTAQYTDLLTKIRNAEMYAMDDTDKAIQNRIYALQDEKTAMEKTTTAISKTVDIAISAASAMKDIQSSSLSTDSPEVMYKKAIDAFRTNTDASKAGELGKAALSASQQYNASGSAYQADYLLVMSKLQELSGTPVGTTADKQLTVLEQIRDAIKDNSTSTLSNLSNNMIGNVSSDSTASQITAAYTGATKATYDVVSSYVSRSWWGGSQTRLLYKNSLTDEQRWLNAGELPTFANGGITSGPSIAGEGSMREAVIPLPDGRTVNAVVSGQADNKGIEDRLDRLEKILLASQVGLSRVADATEETAKSNKKIEQKTTMSAGR